MLVYRQSAILLEKDIFLDLSVPTRFNVHMFPTGLCYLNSSHKSIILSVKTYLLPACATYSKLPSNVNTMPPMTRLLLFDQVRYGNFGSTFNPSRYIKRISNMVS